MSRSLCLLLALGVLAGLAGCDSDDDANEKPGRERAVDVSVSQEKGSGRHEPTAAPSDSTRPPSGVAEPRAVEQSGEEPARVVEEVLGEEVSSGQPVVVGARCREGRCTVRYRSVPRGRGAVLNSQGDVLRRLYALKDVSSVLLYVHHQSTGTPDKNEAPVFVVTDCRRADHPRFAWRRITGSDIPNVCRFADEAGGKLRSLVRRGELTNTEASRGGGPPPKP